MKSYTDIEQSKKLTKILPIESADMIYQSVEDEYGDGTWEALPKEHPLNIGYNNDISCWSLTALLDILPTGKVLLHDKGNHGYKCICNNIDSYYFNNPIDACYEMILQLHKLKIL